MKSKKLKFTIFSCIIHVLVVILFFIKGVLDSTIWAAWFTSFNATIGIYAYSNVKQKEVISKNYVPELVDKG